MPKLDTAEVKVNGDGTINKIAASLAPHIVDINLLKYDPLNARLHPEKNLEAIKESLALFGQLKPIVARRDSGIVVAGNGTLESAKALGWTKIAATFHDMNDAEAAAYGLADNRTAELARWDPEVVVRVESIAAEGGYGMIGWSDDDLLELHKQLANGAGNNGEELSPVFSDEKIIDTVFAYLRKKGFPYRSLPLHSSMQIINTLATAPTSELINSSLGGVVADTYHRHRVESAAANMKSPYETFSDDKALKTAIRKQLELGGKIPASGSFGLLNLSEGTQSCSNFRPGFALSIYRRFSRGLGTVVLDTSTGYGGRLVGFMASGLARYIGIDPNTLTHAANLKMASALGFSEKVELHNLPAEDVDPKVLMNRCDVAFTSPPYFAKEIYSDEPTQSCHRYKTAKEWRDGFLAKMIALQFVALKKGSYSVVNIAPVKLKNVTHPLDEWTVELAKKVGFKYEKTEEYPLKRRLGANNDGTITHTEPVLIFRKP